MGANQNCSRELDLCPKINSARLSYNSIQDHIAIVKLLVLGTGLGTKSQRKYYLVQARVISNTTMIKIRPTCFSHSHEHFTEHLMSMSEKPPQKCNEYLKNLELLIR
jgi:hypothetical protein